MNRQQNFLGVREMSLLTKTIFSLLIFIISVSTIADTQVVGRYVSVSTGPKRYQTYILKQKFQITFPESVHTINDAIHYLLRFSGYRLAPENFQNKDSEILLSESLPEVNRKYGPMTIAQGLQTLAGNEYQLLIDPLHRMISFKLKDRYKKIYQ